MDYEELTGGADDSSFWDALTYGAGDVAGYEIYGAGDDECGGCTWTSGGASDSNSLPTLLILGGLDWDDPDVRGGSPNGLSEFVDAFGGAPDETDGETDNESEAEETANKINNISNLELTLNGLVAGLGEVPAEGYVDDIDGGDGLSGFIDDADGGADSAAGNDCDDADGGADDDMLTAALPGESGDMLTAALDADDAGANDVDGGLSAYVDGGGMLKWTQVQNALRTLPPDHAQQFGAQPAPPLRKLKKIVKPVKR